MNWQQVSVLMLGLGLFSQVGVAASSPVTLDDIETPEQNSIEPEAPEPIAERARKANGMIEQRVQYEERSAGDPFVLTAHKPNYFLPIYYTGKSGDRGSYYNVDSEQLQDTEFKFQVSLKFPVAKGVLGRDSKLWFAYTQESYWQAYNSKISAPFRDTSYEPEAFITTQPKLDMSFFGAKLSHINYGVVHQSNGRGEPLSRSWNRVYADFIFEHQNTVVSIKPWYRIPESEADDDNADIEDYLGHGELTVVHVVNDVTFDVLLRNNLDFADNHGAVRLGVSFPMWGKVRGYAQYFEGYGQSLLDYDNYTRSFGIGFMLSNWL
ncbi:Phospholipase A1 precursor [Marinomonas aquimarina]|uniref:Phospholipase A1 n=1 Tax=Marinomonas aquimarina TaxID=295068 RepID=A0A1A8T6J0_9GAMM|nr:phospholipase A [Marinomonas aquimarina]SBS26924.1 Phospholipase A1 precursor [Marinomonas aquimarina]